MADQIVPNTDDRGVAAYAIAWEIVRIAYFRHNDPIAKPEQKAREMTNTFIDVYNAVFNEEKLPG